MNYNWGPYIDDLKSARLKELVSFKFSPKLLNSLEYFWNAFDHDEAVANDKIRLREGFDTEFDVLQAAVKGIEEKFKVHRRECEAEIKTKGLVFKDLGKEIYQLEVPGKVKVPQNWQTMSKTVAVTRYYTPTIRKLVGDIQIARERSDIAMRAIKSKVYARFDEDYDEWMKVLRNSAEIDCLLSLALVKGYMSEPVCRPGFLDQEEGVLEVQGLRHPCVRETAGGDFIPNDIELSHNSNSVILLTGPNMGGKSTLLRQTCIAVIMAQIGSYVPAQSFKLTTFDRIFTRIGANDNIMAGQSTFMVELVETCRILKDATPRSLVILDELGRGTSTFDGYAIAYSVLYHLLTHIQCLGLFSTHYGALTQEFSTNPLVKLMFMSFVVDDSNKNVTFLYKLTEGVSPASYGMNVARLAQVPEDIISKAEQVASEFDLVQKQKRSDVNVSAAGQIPLMTLMSAVSLFKDDLNPKIAERLIRALRQ